MELKTLHKLLGWTLTIPLLAWALTGIIFLIKPGYDGAYDQLAVQTHPMDRAFYVQPRANWREAKLLRTTLGYHLLLSGTEGTLHLDPVSLQRRAAPTPAELEQLITESLASNPDRYGNIVDISTNSATTDTGVTITLDWDSLSLRQTGEDTDLINTLYKIHYLQWWGNDGVNIAFGAAGIVILLALVLIGLSLSAGRKHNAEAQELE